MVKRYKGVKLPEDFAEIIDKYIVGKEGFRSRSEYVTKTVLEDLIRRGLIKGGVVKNEDITY